MLILLTVGVIIGILNSQTILLKFQTYAKSKEPLANIIPGLLFPRESESREVKSLDGLWDFVKLSPENASRGHNLFWYPDDLREVGKVIKMPVPSSYNDVTVSRELRDHVGSVRYERTFFVPISWREQRVFVRFGSVNYRAQVRLNGFLAAKHEMGHLPFEAEITSFLKYGGKNRITVVVDNTLFPSSVPQGEILHDSSDNGIVKVQNYAFDYFHYAGIHRPVLLHTKPRVYVEDITVRTGLIGDNGIVKFDIKAAGLQEKEVPMVRVRLLDADGTLAIKEPVDNMQGTLKVPSAKLWWPRTMDPNPAYLYTLEVTLYVSNATKPDIYRLPVGIRTLQWTNTSLLINNRKVYFRGFGRHEDSAIRGRGLDLVTMTRDYELLQWVGANAYRTSHYPYSDEDMDMADRLGFLIIDECPLSRTNNFSRTLLHFHKDSLSQLIRRDKNRPSVIMWSVANEAGTQLKNAGEYFKEIARHTKALDSSRPITTCTSKKVNEDKVGQFMDIIGLNKYYSWYINDGRLDMITERVIAEAESWHRKYNKPVIMSEYGADSMSGLHELPAFTWSEEYQSEMFSKHFKAFDKLRAKYFFIGEFIWNFADFRTPESHTRVGGSKKGIFTRERQPKMSAYLVRKRYHALSAQLDGTKMPSDIEQYAAAHYFCHNEL